jgi:putative membrane protein
MKKIVVMAAMLAATSALAQSAAEKSGVNTLMGVAPKTEDFVKEAASSDMFEIESSKLAAERSDAATKTFAQQMIQDHQKTTAELKQLVDGGKVNAALPTAMTTAHQELLDKLNSLQGDEFTQQYRSDQVEAHEEAVDLFKRYGEEGENAELKSWAASKVSALEHHLQMAKELNE